MQHAGHLRNCPKQFKSKGWDIGLKKLGKGLKENGLFILKHTCGRSRVHFFHLWQVLFFGIILTGVHTHAEYSSISKFYGLFSVRNSNLLWFQHACTKLTSQEFRYLVFLQIPSFNGVTWCEVKECFCHSCCSPEWWTVLKASKYQVNTELQEYSIFTTYQKLAVFQSNFSFL